MTKSIQLPNKANQALSNNKMDMNNDCTAASATKKKRKNKKKSKLTPNQPKTQAGMVDAMMNHHVIRHGENHVKSAQKKSKSKSKDKEDDNFWSSTNNTEERQKIREFWLQLGEEERRSLVKVEKEAVLRKMKEQQKHSCNCSVCGKKRTAIEDELEVLYDAYYEELEQYANHQQQTRGSSSALASLPRAVSYIHGRIYHDGYDDTLDEDEDEDEDEDDEDEDDVDVDILGDEDEDDEDEEDEDEDDEGDEDDDENDYENQHNIMTRPSSPYTENSRFDEVAHVQHNPSKSSSTTGDHFSFGNSLTVKGGILTVADDLLKNDGKKFLDMMERLAERRMQKEDTVTDQNTNYFQEEEEEDEDNYEDDEDEQDTRTEEQRMEEGRRMFQIFAARMFEQRVLAAYREKVAQERQQRLLEELEEEDRLREEREVKKQLEREKKKDKKRQLKKQQEEERLALELKKKSEEEALRKQKEKKLELERQKREQERTKKEEERRLREEDRQKKEEERKRKAKEDKEREKKLKEKKEKERREKAEKIEQERKEKAEKDLKEKIEKECIEEAEKQKEKEEKERKVKLDLEQRLKEEEELLKQKASASYVPEKPHTPDDFESRQQVLIEALVGSSSRQSSFNDQTHNQPALSHLQPQPHFSQPLSHLHSQSPFMPVPHHLGGAPAPFVSSSLEQAPTFTDLSPNNMNLFNSRLTTSNTSLLPEPSSAKRSITPIAPIGQQLNSGRRLSSAHPNGTIGSLPDETYLGHKKPDHERGPARSFFSSFLFGEPSKYRPNTNILPNDYDMRTIQDNRRFSCDSQGTSNWTNGWTTSTLLSENVHMKLFGDALPDRATVILERAKMAYQKLNEITQAKVYTEYHTLVQLHCMITDLYMDLPVDIRELHDVLCSPLSGFKCFHHGQHGIVVLYNAHSAATSPPNSSLLSSHSTLQPPGSNPPLFS